MPGIKLFLCGSICEWISKNVDAIKYKPMPGHNMLWIHGAWLDKCTLWIQLKVDVHDYIWTKSP
jgi:hypothetical protein